MDEPVSLDERIRALQAEIDELKRQQRDEQAGLREGLKQQVDAMRSLPPDGRRERKDAIQKQVEEIKRLHREQQESQQAILEKINELKRLDRQEQRESRRTLREQIAEKVTRARTEHEREHHGARHEGAMLAQMDNEQRKGFLKLHVLQALSVRPAHGYELMHWISHHTGHAWQPSPGSMYPALESLEAKGFIACQGDGRRKVYSLTPKGEDAIVQMRKKQMEMFAEMKAFMSTLLDE